MSSVSLPGALQSLGSRLRSRSLRVGAQRPRRTPAQVAAAREIARLRRHFRVVLAELRGRDVAHLSDAQRGERARLIAELEGYARRGRFPRNLDFPAARTPYFVDAFGTRCAMAHLIESTGAIGLVARVAATRNHALVPELAGDPELRAWLDRFGLTAAEATRIQPSYCFITKAEECVCEPGISSSSAVAEVTVIGMSADGQKVVRVDAVHGDMSVIAPGQELGVTTYADTGATLLVGLSVGDVVGQTQVFELNGDQVAPNCGIDVPDLQKDTIVQALLSGDCAGSLKAKDEAWSESICEEEDDGGCAVASGAAGAAGSALPGVLFLAAAVMARRRWAARGRTRARRAR